MNIQLNKKARKEFCQALAKIKKPGDIDEFLTDLLSSVEIKEISRRYLAARLLAEGKTYLEINHLLAMSPITINKIHFKTKGSKILPKIFD